MQILIFTIAGLQIRLNAPRRAALPQQRTAPPSLPSLPTEEALFLQFLRPIPAVAPTCSLSVASVLPSVCRDSAILASIMALAAPSVRKISKTFGILPAYSYLCTARSGDGSLIRWATDKQEGGASATAEGSALFLSTDRKSVFFGSCVPG